MTIQTFIKKAIAGGWKRNIREDSVLIMNGDVTIHKPLKSMNEIYFISEILLDPLAWKAVGKFEGWFDDREFGFETDWRSAMHKMIDALSDGKTLEQFIESL